MRILHISDLHFGQHRDELIENLETRVRQLRPDLILATGDFAHHCDPAQLASARDYLKKLSNLCSERIGIDSEPKVSDAIPARLLAVPGNHDCAYWGWVPVSATQWQYRWLFRGIPTNQFFPDQQVWVYAFNSASQGWDVRSNGKIPSEELNEFDKRYYALKEEFKTKFEYSYKIVALHHHPLPIRYQSDRSRWLSLLNAGEFLGQMLSHGIDLVVHGHEHIDAHATFGRKIRDNNRQLIVVSVGSVSYSKVDSNRFNLICIERDGEVYIETYEAEGANFSTTYVDKFFVHSRDHAENRKFQQTVAEVGCSWNALELFTEINMDGDARRTVFLKGLSINPNSKRSWEYRMVLPETSGYIDLPLAYEFNDQGQRAGELQFKREVKHQSKAGSPKDMELIVSCGHDLEPGIRFSMGFEWWAVNAMAMSRRQARYKYSDEWTYEYTHFAVTEPVHELVWKVKFPDQFQLLSPEPYVVKIGQQGKALRDANLEQRLREHLDFDPNQKLVSLRLRRPLIGYFYGIRWAVQDDVSPQAFVGPAEHLADKLVSFADSGNSETRNELHKFLRSVAEFIRNKLASGSLHDLEVGIMVFDKSKRIMVTSGAVEAKGDRCDWIDRRHAVFEYGEGLGGKAFKSNDVRIYSHMRPESGRTPDYYIHPRSGKIYEILLSVPLNPPKVPNHCYAVLNCGSSHKGSPLAALGTSGGALIPQDVSDVLETVNEMCYAELSRIFQ